MVDGFWPKIHVDRRMRVFVKIWDVRKAKTSSVSRPRQVLDSGQGRGSLVLFVEDKIAFDGGQALFGADFFCVARSRSFLDSCQTRAGFASFVGVQIALDRGHGVFGTMWAEFRTVGKMRD